ncbi:MAG: hypothetical protein H6719_15040 [Sandaracinaceae bacterium]|nr:hypothetical protein [Sandaracinaceae bacterium]
MDDALDAWAGALDDVAPGEPWRLWLQLAFVFEALFPIVELGSTGPFLLALGPETVPTDVPVDAARDVLETAWRRAEGRTCSPERLPELSMGVMKLTLVVNGPVEHTVRALLTQLWHAESGATTRELDAGRVVDIALPALEAVAELSGFLDPVVQGLLRYLTVRTLGSPSVEVRQAREDAGAFASALRNALDPR